MVYLDDILNSLFKAKIVKAIHSLMCYVSGQRSKSSWSAGTDGRTDWELQNNYIQTDTYTDNFLQLV